MANPIKRHPTMAMALRSKIALEIIVGRLLLLTFQQSGGFGGQFQVGVRE